MSIIREKKRKGDCPRFDLGRKIPILKPESSRAELEIEALITEWSLTTPLDCTPKKFITEVKGYTRAKYEYLIRLLPSPRWWERRERIQNMATATLVKRHIDYIGEMNESYIKAAKLGLAKSLELMSKMKVEESRDKSGRLKFKGFNSVDLKNCMDVITQAQKVQRMALGLTTEEGSLHIWQKIEQKMQEARNEDDSNDDTKRGQLKKLSDSLSYDDIKLLIEQERRRSQEGKVIDV